MPRSTHDAPPSTGAKRSKAAKAVKSPAAAPAAPAPAPVAAAPAPVAPSGFGRGKGSLAAAAAVAAAAAAAAASAPAASSRGKGRGAPADAAPVAAKAPRTAAKGVLPGIKRRGKIETPRAMRLRRDPISGISDNRLKVLACQMGLVSLKSEAKHALREIVAANVNYVLQQAIVRAACSRRRTVRTAHLTDAYAAANTYTQQLYLAHEDEHAAPDAGDRYRRSVHKAIAAGSALKTPKRAPAAVAADADEEMFAM